MFGGYFYDLELSDLEIRRAAEYRKETKRILEMIIWEQKGNVEFVLEEGKGEIKSAKDSDKKTFKIFLYQIEDCECSDVIIF